MAPDGSTEPEVSASCGTGNRARPANELTLVICASTASRRLCNRWPAVSSTAHSVAHHWRERTAAQVRASGEFGVRTDQPWRAGVQQRSAAHSVHCNIASAPAAASASRSHPAPANPGAAACASHAEISNPHRTRGRIWCHVQPPTPSSGRQPTQHRRPQRQAQGTILPCCSYDR
jgi:hypothetical protein